MKGILLAGGKGTRMRPLTDFVCKQLLPVYDKPLIYYPLTALILAKIKDILIISTPKDIPILRNAIGDGKSLGVNIEYSVQQEANGIAEAFIIAEDFIADSPVCMVLGDNIIYKSNFSAFIESAYQQNAGATICGFPVGNPQHFGVVELDKTNQRVISLEEKPQRPKSNLAAIGLYLYDNTVVARAKRLKPSSRGELEITDLNNQYLGEDKLKCCRLSRGDIWIDAGMVDNFSDASQLIRLIEHRLGLKIGCPEEASYMMGNISPEELMNIATKYQNSPYGEYLIKTLTINHSL